MIALWHWWQPQSLAGRVLLYPNLDVRGLQAFMFAVLLIALLVQRIPDRKR